MNAVLSDLKRLTAASAFDDFARAQAARDWWPQSILWSEQEIQDHRPLAAARPARIEEVSQLLEWALSQGVAVVPRGGGSGVLGAAIPMKQDSLVLDMTGLSQIGPVESDGGHPHVRLGAGVFGGTLETSLNNKGYSLLHFPASLAISTVGGWISCGAFGQMSTFYGGIEGQILEVTAVRPDGKIWQGAGQEILASEGTLGIITEAVLKIRPQPQRQFFLSFEFSGLAEAAAWLRECLNIGIKPAVTRLYDPLDCVISGLLSSGRHLLPQDMRLAAQSFLLRFDATRNLFRSLAPKNKPWLLVLVFEQEQESQYHALAASPLARQRQGGEAPARAWWNKRFQWDDKKLALMFRYGSFVDTVDAWVPWERLTGVYEALVAAASPYALCMAHISHLTSEGACLYATLAGAGNNRRHTRELHAMAWRAALDAVSQNGGCVNHHHGVGLAKLPWIENALGQERLKTYEIKKQQWDPKGIMNPGKLLRLA